MCTFQEWGLCFPLSCGALAHKPHWPSMPDAPGALSPSARPQAWGFDVGLRTLTPIGEALWYRYFPVCGASLYHIISPPTSWCGLLFVFWSRISFWTLPVHLVEGFPVYGRNFVVFMREVELQSFYSNISILSPYPYSGLFLARRRNEL